MSAPQCSAHSPIERTLGELTATARAIEAKIDSLSAELRQLERAVSGFSATCAGHRSELAEDVTATEARVAESCRSLDQRLSRLTWLVVVVAIAAIGQGAAAGLLPWALRSVMP